MSARHGRAFRLFRELNCKYGERGPTAFRDLASEPVQLWIEWTSFQPSDYFSGFLIELTQPSRAGHPRSLADRPSAKSRRSARLGQLYQKTGEIVRWLK